MNKPTGSMGIAVLNVVGCPDAGVVIAAARCGALGVLNLEGVSVRAAGEMLARVEKFARAPFGVRFDSITETTEELIAQLPAGVEWVVFTAIENEPRLAALAATARRTAKHLWLEVASASQAKMGEQLGFGTLVAPPELLTILKREVPLPVWVRGRIGLHTAAGFYAAGARGVVLDGEEITKLEHRFVTVAGVVDGLQSEVLRHLKAARKLPLPVAGASTENRVKTLSNGARRILVEGGFPAWDEAVDAVVTAIDRGGVSGPDIDILFGDAPSATMLAAVTAPLAEHGVKVSGPHEMEAGSIDSLAIPAKPHAATPEQKPADIAIVGMSCLLPKALDIRTLWRNLLEKVDAIEEIPRYRFDADRYFDADKKTRDRIYSKWGGFLDPVPFDPMRYGIPPASLGSIDPMQLLALVGVENALRDAGYDRREFNRERTSVILGISGGLGEMGVDYAFRSSLPLYIDKTPEDVLKQVPEWTEDSFAGLLPNVAAGRVANRFNFGGVNFIVDAACASSLTSVYVAARELNAGAADMIVVGGVDATQNPFGFLCFSKAQALSPRGRCRPFDASADGIAISEGVTMIVLKRLADAERDGDRIYAVIKGIGGSSDGRGRSMTAPRLEGQVLALRRAYAQAGVDSSTIGLIEAHGTGTSTGDATEIAALDVVFRGDKAAPQSCAVGSIKSMVGHTKSAAGATSLMKVALSLYHKVLPPTLHVETLNPRLREEGTPFFVAAEAQPFLPPAPDVPRRAGISAFGFGGTNFHAVLEEYQGDYSNPLDRTMLDEWPAELFLWSAGSAEELKSSLAVMEKALARTTPPPLRDLAISVCAKAEMAAEKGLRLAIVAASHAELGERTGAARKALDEGKQKVSDSKGLYLAPAGPRGKVAFLFPGQGSQYPNMLRDLAVYFPVFRESLERADATLAGKYPRRISSFIYPPPAFTEQEKQAQMKAITDTVVAQPALGVVEIALSRLFERLGVLPDMTAGHSYGEYVALACAGVLDEEGLFRVSEARGRAIKESAGADSGTMAAVAADAHTVERAVKDIAVSVANFNSPKQTIIAGSTKAVEEALERLKEKKLTARPIPVACAFHSPLMQGACDKLAAFLAKQKFSTPSVPVYSNTLAATYPQETDQIASLLTMHLVRPVRFIEQIESMYEDGARVFLEVGPKGVLSGLSRQILEGKECAIIQTETSSERNGVVQWLHALAQLAVSGIAPRADELFRARDAQRLDLTNLPPEKPKTGWAMNPSKVFPVTQQPVERSRPVELLKPSDVPAKTVTVEKVVTVEKPVEKQVPVPVQAAPGAAPGMDAVLLQFQALMGQFLQTQAAIMTAYLQGAPAAMPAAMPPVPMPSISAAMPAPALQIPAGMPMPAPAAPMTMAPAPVVFAPPAVMAPAPAPVPTPLPAHTAAPIPVAAPTPVAVSAPVARDVAAELLKIAADRTGYPADMLDINAGIEADLGIDSIKRVEILTAFQRNCTADEQAQIQGVMDKLTSARTLKEIIGLLSGTLQSPAPVPTPAAPSRDIAAELLKIAADRTGYPADMLDINAGIEADLGIDSIKRVEILTAFQRNCTADEQTQIQGVMDKLTSTRTLKEIIGLLSGTLQSSSPVPTPAAPSRDVAAELLKIAADRTGYPADMLDINAGIEADLGIDSIKRVEILTAFQHNCTANEQAQIQGAMDKLTSARTLREIIDSLNATIQVAPALEAVPNAVSAVPRFRLAPVEKPRTAAAPRYVPGRVCLITDDETGLAAGIAEEHQRGGEKAILLRHSPGNGIIATEGVFSGDLTDPVATGKILEKARTEYGPVGAIVHLLPLRAGHTGVEQTLDGWKDHVRQDVRSLYALARASENDLKQSGHGLFVVVTARGGSFGFDPTSNLAPTHHGVADFVKTLALEFTGVACKVIDIDPTDPLPILRRKIADEIASGDDTLQVGLPGDRRLTIMPEHAPLPAEQARSITSDWVILLTGGARGITAGVAQKLAERCRPTLILAGASPLPPEEPAEFAAITDKAALKAAVMQKLQSGGKKKKPAEIEAAFQRVLKDREIRDTIARLKQAGSHVEYHSLDVRDEAAVKVLVERIYANHGRLDAVIHGAGIIEDKLLKDKTPESFDRVVHTKVDSTWILSHLLEPKSLQCLVLMSSITAAFGNRAQADYAIANGVMNGFALKLAAEWPCRVVAMNWGPWDQHGMVTEEVRRQFLSRGIHMIPPEGGVEAVLNEMERGAGYDAVVALGDGPWAAVAVPDGTRRTRSRSLGAAV